MNKSQDELMKEIEETQRYLTQTSNELHIELSQLNKKYAKSSLKRDELEVIGKKSELLNDRIQQSSNHQELIREYEMSTDKQIKRLKMLIDELSSEKRENIKQNRFFVLQDLQSGEENLQRLTVQNAEVLNKKESLLRQKTVLLEKVSSLKNEYDVKLKEQDKAYLLFAQSEEESDEKSIESKIKLEVFDHETLLYKERIDFVQWSLKKLSFELTWTEDESVRLKSLISTIMNEVIYVKKHLLIGAKDVAQARDDWKSEVAKVNILKAKNNANKEALRSDRDRRTDDLNRLNDAYKKYKNAGDTKSIHALYVDAQIHRINAFLKKIDMKLMVLDAHNDSYTIQSYQKSFLFKHVQIRFKLGYVAHVETINQWINDLKGRRGALEHEMRSTRNSREESLNSIVHTTSLIDEVSKKFEEVVQLREGHFQNQQKICNDTLSYLSEAQNVLRERLMLVQAHLTAIAPLIPREESLVLQYDSFIRELEQHRLEFNIWYRSNRAISFDGFKKSLQEGEFFFKKFFWAIPYNCNPFSLLQKIPFISWNGYLVISLLLLMFFLLYLLYRFLLQSIHIRLLAKTEKTHGRLGFLYLNILLCCVEFIIEHALLLYTWFFAFFSFRTPFSLDALIGIVQYDFWLTFFFLISMIVFFYLSTKLMSGLKTLNQKLSFFFFNEQSQHKFITLTACVLYSSSILLPLRSAIIIYGVKASELPEVILAAYSLILLIVLLLFFTKDDVLKLVPSYNDFWLFIHRNIDSYYYPVFLFFMGLFILANPYIGYSHLAWFLAFAVPITACILIALVIAYHYIRQYSTCFFFKEEGEDVIDKFEHAKMYYGSFVLFSLFVLVLGSFVAISYLWGFSYSLDALWKLVFEEWTIKLGGGNKLGIIQVFSFVLFIVAGFLVSSVSNHFVLNRLFDIFKTEPGAQNTISRIFHYCILVIFVLFGFATIGLGQLILPFSYLLVIGIGLGLKDQISDFIAGFLVLLERQIEVGDFIQVGAILGTVQKIAVRSTTIRTARNLMIIIPNRTIITTSVTNYSRLSMGLELKIVLRHDTDVAIVKPLLHDIIVGHPTILRVPSPIIRLSEITDVGQEYILRGFISARRVREMWDVASDIRIAIIKTFKEKDIHISCVYPLRVEFAEKTIKATLPGDL
ncbi:mechanosensitive ion channel [Candidatus Babeliales bacterium]|nr:mechanosensitive ion channel [Candidatus Babeliales bacterium]